MTIWDTAGQERFRTLTSSYYRGAQGIVLVYDVSRRDTFENLDLWLQEVEVYSPAGGRNVVKLLVGNKIDKQRVVSRKEAGAWARSKGMLFVESSAKTKIGIQQVFNEVVQKVSRRSRQDACQRLDATSRYWITQCCCPTQRHVHARVVLT